jgi:integrase
MSVRQVTRSRRGRVETFWMIDIDYQHPDGTRERVRRVPRPNTRADAERQEREIMRGLATGTYGREAPEPAPAFDEFSKEFLSTYAEPNNKPSELQTKRTILDLHLVPYFKATPIDEIGAESLARYTATKLRAELAAKTINNHLTVLRKMLDVAREWKRIESVPEVKWLTVPEPAFDFLSFDETDRLIAAAAPEWQPMITVAARTGLRQGELLALSWCDVDLVAGRLFVRRAVARGIIGTPKSGKAREVHLSDQAVAAFKAQRPRSQLRDSWVFVDPSGNMLTKGECKWPLWTACKRAGLARRIGWHVLRHTFASHLVMRGVPLTAAQQLLGHATVEMTMRYAHLSPDVKRDAVRLLDGSPNGNLTATNVRGEQNR